MQIVHITHDMDPLSGGIPAVVRQLSEQLHSTEWPLKNSVIYANGGDVDTPYFHQAYSHPPHRLTKHWCLGPGLIESISSYVNSGHGDTLFHIHGVWSAPQYYGARLAKQGRVPFVVSAHGMLEPWLWNQQGLPKLLKKKAYWNLIAQRALGEATVLHAITPLEQTHLRKLFPRHRRIEVIPNAISIPVSPPAKAEPQHRLLFLGRIEPKKGVHLLIDAFSNARIGDGWTLDIVGPSWSDKYLDSLKRAAALSHRADRICFHGPLFGERKLQILKRAWAMIAPSYSEVVGLVNLEAGVHQLPSITTYQTGLYNWSEGGGLLCEPRVPDLITAIENACSWSEQERLDRGVASFDLVKRHYSWDNVLPLWMELYSSLH